MKYRLIAVEEKLARESEPRSPYAKFIIESTKKNFAWNAKSMESNDTEISSRFEFIVDEHTATDLRDWNPPLHAQ
jgi:hypothetical protein